MATYVTATDITSSAYSACKYQIQGFYGPVSRNGNTVSFSFGVRIKRTTGSYTYNAIVMRYGNSSSGTLKYVQKYGQSNLLTKDTWYYAAGDYKTTTETYAWSYSGTVGSIDAGNISIVVGWNDTLGNPTISSNGYKAYTFSVPYPKGFTNPSWTTYTINSFPSTAYANMPYSYNVSLGCSYGSSSSGNSLAWRSTNNLTMASTTGTSLTGARSYTFSNSNIGTHTFRGVLSYTNASGSAATMTGATRSLTVSFLNPTLTSVVNNLNGTSFYRTSTVSSTSSATMNKNSASPTAFIYFSDTADAPGDSGAGYYQLATNSFSNVTKSYTHRGDRPGTFYSQVVLNGNNGSNTWVNFANYNRVNYTMQQFVAPTCTRTITYNRHGVYVGQTKFPVTVNVTGVSKSQYDTLIPTFSLGTCKNGNWSYDSTALVNHNFATGSYNYVLTKTGSPYVIGDNASFRDEMAYKDALNVNTYTSVDSDTYAVQAIPQPTVLDIGINMSIDKLAHTLTVGLNSNFDSDFVGVFTIIIENESGTVQYQTYTGTISNNDYQTFIYNYAGNISEAYKARLVCRYALSDEDNVVGSDATLYSNSISVYGGAQLYIKSGEDILTFYPITEQADCDTPRLVIKKGSALYYMPLYTDTPPTGSKTLWVKQGATSYYTLADTKFGKLYPSDDLYPEGNELSHEDLSKYTHGFLGNYTNLQLETGDVDFNE